MNRKPTVVGLAIAIAALSWVPLRAQDRSPPWPSAPREGGGSGGLPVSPFFEGWYENPDGTFTLSFGFFNRNTEEVLTLPVGPDNFIVPAEYDGVQPTLLTPGRETGVFTVTVPPDFARNGRRVVWTLRSFDTSPHSVPGKVSVDAYQLHHVPMAMGSLQPVLKLNRDGPELWGPMTIVGDPRTVPAWSEGRNRVGSIENSLPLAASLEVPLTLTVWVSDRLASDAERDPVGGGVTW